LSGPSLDFLLAANPEPPGKSLMLVDLPGQIRDAGEKWIGEMSNEELKEVFGLT
jgi:hypothetical protein